MAFFLVSASAHAAMPAPACSAAYPETRALETGLRHDEVEALLRETRKSACRSFEPYRDVTIPADEDTPIDCTEYGLTPGPQGLSRRVQTFEDALALDCDVLEYRPTRPGTDLTNDPVGDLALACRAMRARQNLSIVLAGKLRPGSVEHQRRIEARNLRSARARECAIQAFGAAYRIPEDPIHDRSAAELLEWADRETDLARIRQAELSPQRANELSRKVENGELTLQGRQRPIDRTAFLDMLNQVIADESRESGLEPSLGTTPRWSPEFRDCLGRRFSWVGILGKQLMVLGIGRGDHFTPTGDEPALHDWILGQTDFSIEPATLFRQAYRLAEGDVSRAIRTIENVLSRHWTTHARADLVQTRKLRPITNTLGSQDDVFGSWYHFFGILLYGLSSESRLKPAAVAEIESLGGHVLSGFTPEPQEDRINRQGAAIGSALRRSLERGDWRAIDSEDPRALEFDAYMNLDEDFSRRLGRQQIRNQPVEHTGQDPQVR